MAIANIPLEKSLLITGPPDTGKASVLRSLPIFADVLYMDLEDPLLVREVLRKPELIQDVLSEVQPGEWLTINRIDHILKYLPLILEHIQNRKILIAATTSSLSAFENTDLFNIHYCSNLDASQVLNSVSLSNIINFGTLPKIYNLEKDQDKIRYLKNFTNDFVDSEILAASQVRNLVPFHLFLPLAAEQAGKKMNFSSIAQDLNVDYKTIQSYFNILTSHQVGFFLKAYDQPIKKVQIQSSRFYFFDSGFHRAMAHKIDYPVVENSVEYNLLFKTFCLNELYKKNRPQKRYKLSYLETKDGVGVDLIVEKPDGSLDVVVFVCAPKILPKHLKHLKNIGKSLPDSHLICITNASNLTELDGVRLIPYELIDSILS